VPAPSTIVPFAFPRYEVYKGRVRTGVPRQYAVGPFLSCETLQGGRVPSPLPQFVSSLSKYYRAEDHYPLIASILQDTPESEIRKRFGENLYATGRKRYLTIKNRTVIKDRLVDFVHEEDGFTERVKMVMYFLFMFRDARYRQFICERVATKDGKWETEIFRDTVSRYPIRSALTFTRPEL
jgi:hypothetical protein